MRKKLLSLLLSTGLASAALPAAGEDLWGLYQKALENDPQFAAADASYRASQEAIPQAQAGLLPNIGLDGSAAHIWQDNSGGVSGNGNDDFNSLGYSLTLVQPVFDKQALVTRSQAESRVAQAAATLDSARNTLILRTATAYFDLLAAQDTLEFAVAEKAAIEQQLRQTRQRFEVGLTAITDVHEAQARYDLAVSQEIAARNALDLAHETIREIIGTAPDTLAGLGEFPLVVPDPSDVEAWVKSALDNNTDLMAAVAGTRVAQEEIDRQRAGHYPTVNFVADHSYSDTTDYAYGNRSTDNTLSFQVSVPIYTGGLVSSRVTEAVALYQQAQDNLEATRRSTVRSARNAYLNVISGKSQVEALRQSVASSETALRATQAGFEVGTRTAVDVLDAQRELFLARRDFSRSRYDYILATLLLQQAAGTLDAEDIRAVNGWLE